MPSWALTTLVKHLVVASTAVGDDFDAGQRHADVRRARGEQLLAGLTAQHSVCMHTTVKPVRLVCGHPTFTAALLLLCSWQRYSWDTALCCNTLLISSQSTQSTQHARLLCSAGVQMSYCRDPQAQGAPR